MTKKIYILFILLLSLSLSKRIFAQQYPVDCRILLSPPYSSNLGDYANSPMRFRVQLLLRDLSKPSLEVSLRIRLKGAGVWIENPADFISTQSIVLTPGVPKLLSGIELGENFASQNLEAQGVDINELYAGSPLPVGPYEWEVYAVELYRNRQVSNIGNARLSINYNYPPLLNTPQGLQMATQPQNLRFSWTPRHTASPTAAAGVVYTLFLYEIPEGEDPQMIVNSGLAPYRTIETTQPYYNYDVSEIPLTLGKQYAWMVHVTDFEGKDTFVNNGYSEIKTFQYGKAKCGIPTNLISQIEADGAVKLSWDTNLDAQSYILSYQASDGPIQVEEILSNEHYLLNQEKGKSYIWQVNCNCGIGNTSATAKNNFSIPADEGTSWLSDPTLTYEGESYPPETETEPSTEPTETVDDTASRDNTTIEESTGDEPASLDIDALLNTPVQILVPAEGQESLPENVPSTLTVLPADASIEALQAALKTKKPLCAGVNAAFTCGNHDNVPQYSGSLVSIGAGDEIAMNSMVLSVVSIDGGGNGEGLIKVPMMGNIKLGVRLSGIQVAEGGCIVGGRAELSGVAVSLLSDKQKVELTKAYNTVTAITKTAIANAGAIAETYNTIAEALKAVREKAKALIAKIDSKKTPTPNEVKALQTLAETAIAAKEKELDLLKKNGQNPEYITSLGSFIGVYKTSLECLKTIEAAPTSPPATEIKKGPAQYEDEFFFVDCSLEGLTKVEPESSFTCNCSPIISDCSPIRSVLDQIKEANTAKKTSITITKPKGKESLSNDTNWVSALNGIDIGGNCFKLNLAFLFEANETKFVLADYKLTEIGLDLVDKNGNSLIIGIIEEDKNLLKTKKGVLFEYLGFGKKLDILSDILTIKIYEDGRIVKFVPKKILEEYKKQYISGAGKNYPIQYIYYKKNGESKNLGTYNYFLIKNPKPDARWSKNAVVDLIDIRTIIQVGYELHLDPSQNESERYYLNPCAMGAIIGACTEVGYTDIDFRGFSRIDGRPEPSTTHYNGYYGDFGYFCKDQSRHSLSLKKEQNHTANGKSYYGWSQMDEERQNKFNDALHRFGWDGFWSWEYNGKYLHNSTPMIKHDHHLHVKYYYKCLNDKCTEYEK